MAFTWPNGKKSAVSISADDGWPSQLTQAQRLEYYGFRGTFYLTPAGLPSVVTNAASWRSVQQAGHEVGNHSYSHWSAATVATKTWVDVATDVGTNEQWLLTNIFNGTPTDHTYAYPEGNFIVGPGATSSSYQQRQVGACEYVALLTATMTGARISGTGENVPEDVMRRRFFISGLPITGANDATVIAQAKAAIDNGIAKGTWTVLVFHSLGDPGDGNAISFNAYEQIVGYLYSRQADVWVAPVVTVKNQIAANSPATDWSCTLP